MKSKTAMFMFISTLSFTQLMSMSHAAISQNALSQAKPTEAVDVNDLKNKLDKLETDLKLKEAIIDRKTKALEGIGTDEANQRIEKLNKLLDDQKKQIADLEEKIKTAEDKNKNEFAVALCQAQLHSSKLEEEMKQMLKDKEEVLNEIKLLKDKKETASSEQDEKSKNKKDLSIDSEANVALLAKLTDMMLTQQQAQSQMQMQMYSLMQYQPANNYNDFSMMGFNPYNYQGLQNSLSFNSNYTGYPGYSPSYGIYSNNNGIGLSSNNNYFNPTNVYNNSYSARTPSSTYPGLDITPSVRSFDFTQPQNFTPMMQPSFPQMQRGNIL